MTPDLRERPFQARVLRDDRLPAGFRVSERATNVTTMSW
jgi:hypothetical protein